MKRSTRLLATALLNQYSILLCISICLDLVSYGSVWVDLARSGSWFDLARSGRSGLIWLDHLKSEQHRKEVLQFSNISPNSSRVWHVMVTPLSVLAYCLFKQTVFIWCLIIVEGYRKQVSQIDKRC